MYVHSYINNFLSYCSNKGQLNVLLDQVMTRHDVTVYKASPYVFYMIKIYIVVKVNVAKSY